jgi:toxin ParE1/3/4
VTFTFGFTEEATQDLAEAIQWYGEQKKGLDDDFVLCLKVAFDQIKRNPLAFQLKSNQTRVALLHRFPYKVIFKIYGTTIKIYGVFHHSRNPKFIRKRLK